MIRSKPTPRQREARRRNILPTAQHRHAGSLVLQKQYLAVLAEVGFRTLACEQVGIAFATPGTWAARSPAFKLKAHAAEEQGRVKALDALAVHAYDLAKKGWKRPIYQKGVLVGYDNYFPVGLIETVLDRLSRGNWAASPNAVTVNATGPAAIQINLGDSATRRAYHGPQPSAGEESNEALP